MKQIKLINKISKILSLSVCLWFFGLLPISASSEELHFNVSHETSTYTPDQFGNDGDLTGIQLAMLQAYSTWSQWMAFVNVHFSTDYGPQSGWVNVQDYLDRQKELDFERFFPVDARDSIREGTEARNGNALVSPTSVMLTSTNNTQWFSTGTVYNLAPGEVYNIIYSCNSQTTIVNPLTNHRILRGGIDAYSTSSNAAVDVAIRNSPTSGTCVIDISNNTSSIASFGISFNRIDYNGVSTANPHLPINSHFLTVYFSGLRNRCPRDLYDIFFPTSPEVDAINYKSDRIIEALSSQSTDLSSIVSYLHSANVLNGSTNDMVEQLLDMVPDQLYTANEELQDISDTVQQTQDYLEDELDPVSAITEAEDGTNESYELADEFVDEILPFSPAEVFAPLERFLDIQETGAVVLPIPLFPDLNWTLDLEKFFHYNLATRSALSIIRWILRYEVAKKCMNYICNRLFILVGLEELQNIVDDMLPL